MKNDFDVLIDVRLPEMYNQHHIAGAKNIPLDTIDKDTAAAAISGKDAKVGVYCRGGRQAAMAKGLLEWLGYTDVTNLGGIDQAEKNFAQG